MIAFFLFAEHGGDAPRPVRQGFAIFGQPRLFAFGVIAPQLVSWVFRIASLYYFLRAFGVHATLHNALLAQVVDSLATLFPATPGGAGTKQGLIVFLFRGEAVSKSLLLAFSVGMNVAIVVFNLLLGDDRDRSDGAHACAGSGCGHAKARGRRAGPERHGLACRTRRSTRS